MSDSFVAENEGRTGGGAESPSSPVGAHNEWDPLEEVLVGRLDGATTPSRHPVVSCNVPPLAARFQQLAAGLRYPRGMVGPAQEELEQFVTLLQSLGITVTRPDPVDHRRRFSTPDWSSCGFCNSCPRDSMLVIGDEIIETPMAWPCRYFETYSYRALLKDYFRRGARCTAAPRPPPAHRRTVRLRLPDPSARRADALHPDRVRAGVRRR